MSPEHLKEYLLSLPESEASYPFGPTPVVYKVGEKMFALATVYRDRQIVNLKCDPHQAQQLRDVFTDVIAGYHMNKTHWNTVFIQGDVPDSEIECMIDHSYALVIRGMTRKARAGLEARHGSAVLYRGL
ncbi:MmcQ/YjbR family DNA-binding protein [Thalassolituus sp.]|uniref:MmcQ/YjbR family DNA-binding protein n=1 Tax=Thalassolituus sp. TaxID=2030822 RepID=UPI003510E339